MSYYENCNRKNIPEDKLDDILDDSKILSSNIIESNNFINISKIPKNLNPYSQETFNNNNNLNNESNEKNGVINDNKKGELINLNNIIKIPSFFQWNIEKDQKNMEKNLNKIEDNTKNIPNIRSSFTKDDIKRSEELRKILFSSLFVKSIQENLIETKKESSTNFSRNKTILKSNLFNKGITNKKILKNSYYTKKKKTNNYANKGKRIVNENNIIIKIFLNKFEKLFAYFDLFEINKKLINTEEKNVHLSSKFNTDFDSFIRNLCGSITSYPNNSNSAVYISGKNYIEYGYEKYDNKNPNIFLLEKIKDHKYEDVNIKELNEFIKTQPLSNSIPFEMLEKKRKRPKKTRSKKSRHPIKCTKNKLAKKLLTSKFGNKKQYFLNELNFYGNSLKKLLYAPDLHEESIIKGELLENIFRDKNLKDILKIKNKSKKYEKIDNLETFKNTEYILIFRNDQKKELGEYKIHFKEHEIIFIIYLYYSIIKKHIELLNKSFYSHGKSTILEFLCYKISFFIDKCNDFTKKVID